MRRLLAVLSLGCSAAQAALPLYNTDLLASGESAATWSAYQARLESDLGVATGTGSSEVDTLTGTLALQLGLSDRLNGVLTYGFTDEELHESYTADLGGGPVPVELSARQKGDEDLGLGLSWRLSGEPRHALVARLGVYVPTASDYPGRASLSVSGNTLQQLDKGGRGKGYTRFLPQLAGSVAVSHGAYEWELRAETDDEKATEDRYEVVLGHVHHLGSAAFLRLAGSAAWQQGSDVPGQPAVDSEDYGLLLTAAYDPMPGLRLTARYAVDWLSDQTWQGLVPGGQQNQQRQAGTLAISYLLP